MTTERWGTPEWHRQHPIFGTDFSKPPHEMIEEIRRNLARLRGQLGDIGNGYPGFREQLEDAAGLLTCGISYLHHVKSEMEKLRPAPAPGGADSEPVRVPVEVTRRTDDEGTLSFDAPGLTTVRTCIDCGVLLAGGPTRCLPCAAKTRPAPAAGSPDTRTDGSNEEGA